MNETNTTKDEVTAIPEIFEYIRRNKNGKKCKIGIIVGVFNDNKIGVGWSKTNWKSGDRFNFHDGMKLAKSRSVVSPLFYPGNIPTPVPADIRKQVRNFGARTVKYFKGATELHMPV